VGSEILLITGGNPIWKKGKEIIYISKLEWKEGSRSRRAVFQTREVSWTGEITICIIITLAFDKYRL
jgi:hypothetical protein